MIATNIYPNTFLVMLFLFFFILGVLLGWNIRGEFNESVEKRAQELRNRNIKKRQVDNVSAWMVSNYPDKNIKQ